MIMPLGALKVPPRALMARLDPTAFAMFMFCPAAISPAFIRLLVTRLRLAAAVIPGVDPVTPAGNAFVMDDPLRVRLPELAMAP